MKYNINISIIIRFKQYHPSIIQSVVLRMIVKMAYILLSCPKMPRLHARSRLYELGAYTNVVFKKYKIKC